MPSAPTMAKKKAAPVAPSGLAGAEDHRGEGHEAAAGGHAIGEDLQRAHRQLGAAERAEHAAEAERDEAHARRD